MTNTNTKTSPPLKEYDTLWQQHSVLKNLLERANEDGNRYKQRLDRMAAALQERERRIAELQLFEQRYKKSGEKSQEFEKQLSDARRELKKSQEEKNIAEIALSDSQQHTKQLERVILFLRERAETSHLELKQVQEELKKRDLLFLAVNQEFDALKDESEFFRQQFRIERSSKIEAEEELHAIRSQWQQLQQAARNAASSTQTIKNLVQEKYQLEAALLSKDDEIALAEKQLQLASNDKNSALQKCRLLREEMNLHNYEIQQQQDSYTSKKKEIANLNSEMTILHAKITELESTLAAAKNQIEEKDAALKMAQQYLAKRVKEATLLTEKNETKDGQIRELINIKSDQETKISDLQKALEQQLEKETQLHAKLEEKSMECESLNRNWDEKYGRLYEKMQETEIRNKELKVLEEKHQQMQSLLTNLTALTIPTLNSPSISSSVIEVIRSPFTGSAALDDPKNLKTPLNQEQPELFDTQKSRMRYKQNLFD